MSYGLSIEAEPKKSLSRFDNYFQNIAEEQNIFHQLFEKHQNPLYDWMAYLPDGEELEAHDRDGVLAQFEAALKQISTISDDEFEGGKEPFVEEMNLAMRILKAIPSTSKVKLGIG